MSSVGVRSLRSVDSQTCVPRRAHSGYGVHQLNTSKTELMWCCSFGRRDQLPTNSLIIGLDDIKPVAIVKNLVLYLDATMPMRNHISHLTSTDPLHSAQFVQSRTYNAHNMFCFRAA